MARWRDTPGHAWLILNEQELARMPECARRAEYEEDCEWSIAVLALPELAQSKHLFTAANPQDVLDEARTLCRDHYPDIYEQLTGEKATPENSLVRAEQKFTADHADDWVVVSASGSWHEFCPEGMVLCTAVKGGWRNNKIDSEHKTFLVPQELYRERSQFGYVVPKDKEVEWELEWSSANR